MTDSPVDQLAQALDQAGRALDTVSDDNLDNATPCSDWTVRQLAAHVASGPGTWARMARGEEVDWSALPEVPDGEWARPSGAAPTSCSRRCAGLPEDQQGSAGFQVAEYAVHSWDLCAGPAPTSPSTTRSPRPGWPRCSGG